MREGTARKDVYSHAKEVGFYARESAAEKKALSCCHKTACKNSKLRPAGADGYRTGGESAGVFPATAGPSDA
jgi:hypothetical protein